MGREFTGGVILPNSTPPGSRYAIPMGIADLRYLLSSAVGVAGGTPALDANASLLPANMPRVLSGVTTVNPATGALTAINAAAAAVTVNNYNYVCTGNVTFPVPTSGTDTQVLQLSFLASGAQRTVTFNASIQRLTGITALQTVPSGKVLRAALRYCGYGSVNAWLLESVGITQ